MSFAPSFSELISDRKAQPDWRGLAKKCVDYYDHKQLTQEQIDRLHELGMPDIVENLVQPAINSVLGNEAQRRQDWMVSPDDDDSQEVAEGLNSLLNEHMKLCEANSRCSEAYASQIKSGIGWLHVRRSDNPMKSEYAIEYVHRDEISWDMRGRAQDLVDSRWLSRRRFLDVDEAKAFLPKKHHALVDLVANSWQNPEDHWEFAEECGSGRFEQLYAEWQSASANIEYVIDSQRKRVALYEVYYREFKECVIIAYSDGRKEEYVKGNPLQIDALMAGEASASKAVLRKMRRRWFLGPHEVEDEVSPYPHDLFPYVPFFGYREDDTNIPYGIVRSMIDPQDAYNNCNVRIHHILNTKRVSASNDATDLTAEDVQHEISRKDGYITLRNGKRYGTDLIVEQDWQELIKLIGLCDRHEQKIRDCSGVYHAYSGKETGNQSGVAIASLAELGAVTLAEINDNYAYARKMLAGLVLAYIVHDLGDAQRTVMAKNDHGQNRKKIVLNRQASGFDHGRDAGASNSVALAKYQVALTSVHASPGYRQHLYARLMEMYQVAPDFEKSILFPMLIENSEMPRKEEFLKKYNEAKGIVDDPEQQKQQQAAQQQKQADAEAMAKAMAEVEIMLKKAQAAERQAQAALDEAKAAQVLSGVEYQREQARNEESDRKSALIEQAMAQIAA